MGWAVGWFPSLSMVILMQGDGALGGLGSWLVYLLVVDDFDAR